MNNELVLSLLERGGRVIRAPIFFTLFSILCSESAVATERVGDMFDPSHHGVNSGFTMNAFGDSLGLTSSDAVRDSLDLISSDLVSMSFGTSDQDGFDVFSSSVTSFPTMGPDYFVMSSGATASVLTPNDSPNKSTILTGLNNSQGQDLVQIVMVLQPPTGASCFAFDFALYSEEFPEFVGSQFNDAFIAEIGQSTFQIIDNQVIAPNNFAFDTNGNVVSVNTVFGVTAGAADGTTFDGGTPLLTAKTPLETPGARITITLSIMDLGDSIYDSAVFVDNMRWLYGVACEPGADADTDRDALLDGWESDGIDFDNDGTIDLDLPAMGADPMHKDIFIEIDYMVLDGMSGHTHEPKVDALQIVIDAFANAPVSNPDGVDGITVHIDAGPDTIMDPLTSATWGSHSRSDVLTHQNNLGTCTTNSEGRVTSYSWSEFDVLKGLGMLGNFDIQRADVFHYSIFGHSLCSELGSTSGISRGIPASDFLVTLGGWSGDVGTANQQAGTLMHEFGHNAGLRHGGDDHANREPNYLSVMNYNFQTRGLRISGADGNFDFSSFQLSPLNENALDETAGIGGPVEANNHGTLFCDPSGTFRTVDDIKAAIDWDWSNSGTGTDTNVSVDINCSGTFSILDNTDNWDEFIFNGGAVGQLGEDITLPTEVNEPGLFDLTETEDAGLPTDFAVSVIGPSVVYLAPGKSAVYAYEVTNTGDNSDTVTIDAQSDPAWSNVSGFPLTDGFNVGESKVYQITTTVPVGTVAGATGELTISASSDTNAAMMDQTATTTVVSIAAIDVMPDSARNPIQIGKMGEIPVVILGSDTFDVALIDGSTVKFGPAGVGPRHGPNAHLEGEDVNLDGYLDREFHFETQATGLVPGDTQVCLTGMTFDGVAFGDCEIVDAR